MIDFVNDKWRRTGECQVTSKKHTRVTTCASRDVLAAILFILLAMTGSGSAFSGTLIVLDFDLHDLTLNPDTKAETERTATLRPLLVDELSSTHKLTIQDNPPSAAKEAAKGQGYVFDRPALAGRIAAEAGAEWVVSGRLHKASFLFVYLKAQLIRASSGKVEADFVVEIKGPQKKLTAKGVETLAVQVNDALVKLGAR